MTPQGQTIAPEQAIDTLDQAVSKLSTDRNGHIILQQCIQTLKDATVQAQDLGRKLIEEIERGKEQASRIESLREQLRIALESPQSDQGQSETVDAEFVA